MSSDAGRRYGVSVADGDANAELRRKFNDLVAGVNSNSPRQLAAGLGGLAATPPDSLRRPDLRRPSRTDDVIFRVRVDLDHSAPPIWRRIDLRSDQTLDVLHQVLQVAFGWDDYHLHRFSLGGGPFDRHSTTSARPRRRWHGRRCGVGHRRIDETQMPAEFTVIRLSRITAMLSS